MAWERRFGWLLAVAAALHGCAQRAPPPNAGSIPPDPRVLTSAEQSATPLQRSSCEALERGLVAAWTEQVEHTVELEFERWKHGPCGGDDPGLRPLRDPRVFKLQSRLGDPGGPVPGTGAARSADAWSNLQVPGVDELDRVKTDGRRLVVLDDHVVHVLAIHPPKLLVDIPLPDCPCGLFLHADQLVVFSSQAGQQGSQCAPDGCRRRVGDGSSTRVLTFDLGAPERPRQVRDLAISGSLIAARRVGTRIHLVVTETAPELPPRPELEAGKTGFAGCYLQEREMAARAHADRLKAAWIADLPNWTRVPSIIDNGQKQRLCDAVFEEHQGERLASVVAFDLAASKRGVVSTTIFGSPEVAMMTSESLFLVSGAVNRSLIHHFRVEDRFGPPRYAGSGWVRDRVRDPFSLDVWNGHLRVVHGNSMAVFRIASSGGLEDVGHLVNLAPLESVRAVRFLGSRGYVVTYRVTDPLFVLDLSRPEHPHVTGQLELPGYSTYLHPLDEHHLIGTGFFGREDSPGEVYGVGIQLFDVSDPEHPKRVQQAFIDGSSPVQANHLAFSYWPSERVLAIPVNERRRAPGSEAAVYLYDVSLPSKLRLRGVIRRAAEPTRTRESGASGARIETREPEFERVLLIDGRVFSVARDRIQVHTLTDLSRPVADIRLP